MSLQTNSRSDQEHEDSGARPNYTEMLEQRRYEEVRKHIAEGRVSVGQIRGTVNTLIRKHLGQPLAKELIREF
jgi:hypothetical protein